MSIKNIYIPINGAKIRSTIYKPPEANTIVFVSHGPGSGRFNLRNKQLANQLYDAGYSTLLIDWLKIKQIEESNGGFDELKMAKIIGKIIHWIKNNRDFNHLSTAIYGSNIGAAAALIMASEMDDLIQAVISKNGRLELAESYLKNVKTPTFIAVGKNDKHLLEQNIQAYEKLNCPKNLEVVSGICPFLEEPKQVEKVGKMAINWIDKHLMQKSSVPSKIHY